MRRPTGCAALVALALLVLGCEPFATVLGRNVDALVSGPAPAPRRVADPVRPDARLAALWVGHATVLLQIEDRFVLTDPVLTNTVGVVSARLVAPGLAAEDLPALDAAVISHMHFDHLSPGSLDLLEDRLAHLLVPWGGLVYVPNYDFAMSDVRRWETVEHDGLRITAVPVRHEGHRYGADDAWMHDSFTGWVIEHRGVTVYFGGDTAWDERAFRAVRDRFSDIDLALLPIGPIAPRDFTDQSHLDGDEAVRAFEALAADHLIPIHYDTFQHSSDDPGAVLAAFRRALRARGVSEERVTVLPIGGQAVLLERAQ